MDNPTYFDTRMAALGITPALNTIDIWQTQVGSGDKFNETILQPLPIFRPVEKGIDILVYTLDRCKLKYNKEGTRWKDDYCITRLETPITGKSGDPIKYLKPKNQPSYPFFPPGLIAKYDAKAEIKVLYLTEGFFKAFKAGMHGIDCVGMQSITCLRDKETNMIYDDILKLVATCQVQRIVWLVDGDFMNITSKDITEGTDIYKRPHQFYSTTYTFYELTSNLACEKYFAHINSEELTAPDGNHPKGLDDLLCAFPDQAAGIAMEMTNFSIVGSNKTTTGQYTTRINITNGVGKVKEYFKLHDVNQFFIHHQDRRPDLKSISSFIFNGTTYKWDHEKNESTVDIPKEVKDYFRAGNDYYKKIMMPMADKRLIPTISGRAKGTITDDFGKNFIRHVIKYEGLTVIPDHMNYQQVIHNHYNMYRAFTHEPEEGDCDNILDFFKHIFGTDPVQGIPRYELGLDYATILLKYPQQILPILCLVSKERRTGKSTFGELLDWIFVENVIFVGNEDIKGDFNAHYATKLVIICDETKIDNHEVLQKVKRLSTATTTVMNAKGKDHVTVPFFAKFLFMSNSVEDFIKIDKEEIRFWVQHVKPLGKPDIKLKEKMKAEIPAFIHYLMGRKMVSDNVERHWFHNDLLYTPALDKVKKNSISGLEKRIIMEVTQLFEAIDTAPITLQLPLNYIAELCNKTNDKTYVQRVLNDMGYKASDKVARFEYPVITEQYEANPTPGSISAKAARAELRKGHGRYYEFHRKDFVPDDGTTQPQPAIPPMDNTTDDLPF